MVKNDEHRLRRKAKKARTAKRLKSFLYILDRWTKLAQEKKDRIKLRQQRKEWRKKERELEKRISKKTFMNPGWEQAAPKTAKPIATAV